MSRAKIPMLEVKKAGAMGRGLFATKNIKKGTVIEQSPTIRLSPADDYFVDKTILQYYKYGTPNDYSGDSFMALGFGSLFNHSDDPNVDYWVRPEHQDVLFKAKKNLKKGEQLFIDYGYWEEEDGEI